MALHGSAGRAIRRGARSGARPAAGHASSSPRPALAVWLLSKSAPPFDKLRRGGAVRLRPKGLRRDGPPAANQERRGDRSDAHLSQYTRPYGRPSGISRWSARNSPFGGTLGQNLGSGTGPALPFRARLPSPCATLPQHPVDLQSRLLSRLSSGPAAPPR